MNFLITHVRVKSLLALKKLNRKAARPTFVTNASATCRPAVFLVTCDCEVCDSTFPFVYRNRYGILRKLHPIASLSEKCWVGGVDGISYFF